MSRGLDEILLIFEWLVHRSPVPIAEACDRFGLTRQELEEIVDTLASVGLNPGTPDVLLEAFVDEEDDLVSIRPFDGLRRGVSFDIDAARRLYAAALAVEGVQAFPDGSSVRGAIEKLGRALGEAGADLDAMRADLRLPGAELVAPLQDAILRRRRIGLTYRAPGAAETRRKVDPIGVFRDGANWYLDNFDHSRGERRIFRLDRIGEMEETGDRIETSYEPRLRVGVEDAGEPVRVELDCAPGAAWLAEHLDAPIVAERDGRTLLAVDVRGTEWLIPLLLAAGPDVRVLEPKSLRAAVVDAVDAALAPYEPKGRSRR